MIPLKIQESGKGPNLVLLHGWAMNNLVWQPWLADLEKSYRVIRVELPGHGNSQYTKQWNLEELLSSMALRLPSCSAVLGWSLGGMVGLAYASQYPNRVSRLVMLASSAKFVRSEDWPCAQPEETVDFFSKGLIKNPTATFKRFIRLQTHGAEPSREINEFLKSVVKKNGERSIEGMLAGLSILRQDDLRALLCRLKCPMMMVLGEKDSLVPLEAGAESAQINPDIHLNVIDGAAHVPFLSHPREVLQGLGQFIKEGCVA